MAISLCHGPVDWAGARRGSRRTRSLSEYEAMRVLRAMNSFPSRYQIELGRWRQHCATSPGAHDILLQIRNRMAEWRRLACGNQAAGDRPAAFISIQKRDSAQIGGRLSRSHRLRRCAANRAISRLCMRSSAIPPIHAKYGACRLRRPSSRLL